MQLSVPPLSFPDASKAAMPQPDNRSRWQELVKHAGSLLGYSQGQCFFQGGMGPCDKKVRARVDPVAAVSVTTGEFAAIGPAAYFRTEDFPGIFKVTPV